MQQQQNNRRSRPTPTKKAIFSKVKEPDVNKAKGHFPPLEHVNHETGELYYVYQYKARFHYQAKFAKDPEKPIYNHPDYMIIMEYWRKHPSKKVSFLDMVRELVLVREWKCKEVIVFDNTGQIDGNIMYHSFTNDTEPTKFLVNYLFPNRPGYQKHPRQA